MLFNEECNMVTATAVAEGIVVDIEISPIRMGYDSSLSEDRAEEREGKQLHFDFYRLYGQESTLRPCV
jgi:hypothetical protein